MLGTGLQSLCHDCPVIGRQMRMKTVKLRLACFGKSHPGTKSPFRANGMTDVVPNISNDDVIDNLAEKSFSLGLS